MTSPVRLAHHDQEIRQAIRAAQQAGRKVGLVPTMGALHEGHLSLARASRQECDVTVATIFVNPTQFGPDEDLDQYPRTLDADLEALADEGVDWVFAPTASDMYPPGFSTRVDPPQVAHAWEGEHRPGHFRGVATVVLKLFHIAPADVAYFGLKDYQQSLVIGRMVRDLNLPIEIRTCPIVREKDGLAMSSRNRYLDTDQRRRALAIYQALQLAKQQVAVGERNALAVQTAMRELLVNQGVEKIDYAVIAHAQTLQPMTEIQLPAVVLIAAHVGTTRLIDNLVIDEPPS